MKITGLALVLMAAGILAFAAFVAIDVDYKTESLPQARSEWGLVFPIATAVVMGIAGVLLYVFGGRGYIVIRHPRVQPVESRVVTNSVHLIEGDVPRAVPQPAS
jgi:hypothetical protein